MRKVSELLDEIRSLTQNSDFSSTSGISDEIIIGFLRDGQRRIQTLVSNTNSIAKQFVREDTISLVANQEEYSLPRRLFYNKEIENIEYSHNGQAANFLNLEKRSFFNRTTTTSNYPVFYYRRLGKIYINPVPTSSQGVIRVLYETPLDGLDKRRGKISTVNGLTSTSFTSIVIDSSADETSSPINLTNVDYICINDKDGNVTAYNIPFGSYNSGTNTFTPAAGFTFAFSGETIAVDSYVTFGKWSTTHSKLPDEYETYLIQYSVMRIYEIDSSTKVTKQTTIVEDIESQIVSQSASQTGEIQNIPQTNYDEWW